MVTGGRTTNIEIEVAEWFREATRGMRRRGADWRPAQADLTRLARLVTLLRDYRNRPRNPVEINAGDIDWLNLTAVRDSVADLRKTLPKLLAIYARHAAPAAELPALQALQDAAELVHGILGDPPGPGASRGRPQKRSAADEAASRPDVWPAVAAVLAGPIAEILRTAKIPASVKSPTGPLISVLVKALEAVEGRNIAPGTIVTHFRRNPPRLAHDDVEF